MDAHGGNIYKLEKEFNISKEDIVDFSSNINPLGISEKLKNEIINNMDILQYYPDPEYNDLKSAIARYIGDDTDHIFVGNGAVELIFLYARILKPETALILSPGFIEYSLALNHAGTKIAHYRLNEKDNFYPDIQGLKKEMEKGYELIVICNPNNPTSMFIEPEAVLEIISFADKRNQRVLLDESFIEFVDPAYASSNISLFKKYRNVFLLRSLTKFFAIPGLRLGYAVSHDSGFMKSLKKYREPWTVNQFADLAGRTLLKDKDYISNSVELVSKEKAFLYSALSAVEWLKPFEPFANFMLVKLQADLTSADLKGILQKQGILIRDASNFKFLNNKFVRFAVKNRKCNEKLLNALSNIG
ncbi:MAG: threonine-phosphate decarboxylase [Spirochaetes bacterium]|nr:threonine-phosphate decarboxylase [Spirochaetota bacterium]